MEIIYLEVHGRIWSVIPYVNNEKWMNLQLPPANLDLIEVFCFELVNDGDFQGRRKSGAI